MSWAVLIEMLLEVFGPLIKKWLEDRLKKKAARLTENPAALSEKNFREQLKEILAYEDLPPVRRRVGRVFARIVMRRAADLRKQAKSGNRVGISIDPEERAELDDLNK